MGGNFFLGLFRGGLQGEAQNARFYWVFRQNIGVEGGPFWPAEDWGRESARCRKRFVAARFFIGFDSGAAGFRFNENIILLSLAVLARLALP
jgi:hypothetical protein